MRPADLSLTLDDGERELLGHMVEIVVLDQSFPVRAIFEQKLRERYAGVIARAYARTDGLYIDVSRDGETRAAKVRDLPASYEGTPLRPRVCDLADPGN